MEFARVSPNVSNNTECSFLRFSERYRSMLISTVVFLFFLFLVYTLFLLASRKSDARQAKLEERVAEALRGLGPDAEVQISRDDSIGGSPLINRLLSSLDFIKRLDGMGDRESVA